MRQLTITAPNGTTTTTHANYDAASRALLTHARCTDTYVCGLTESRDRAAATFQLVRLDDHGRAAGVTARATIEPTARVGVGGQSPVAGAPSAR